MYIGNGCLGDVSGKVIYKCFCCCDGDIEIVGIYVGCVYGVGGYGDSICIDGRIYCVCVKCWN